MTANDQLAHTRLTMTTEMSCGTEKNIMATKKRSGHSVSYRALVLYEILGLCVPRRTSRVLASVGNVVVYGQLDSHIKCSEALMSIHESLKVSPPRFQDTWRLRRA